MNRFYQNLALLLVCCLSLLSNVSNGQLVINSGASPEDLANSIVGTGVTVSNVQMRCGENAFGTFSQGSTTNIGINEGILLSTGRASDANGPNVLGNTSFNHPSGSLNGDDDLDPMTPFSINDVCELSFDFVAESDMIMIQYVFASEEYNEYVCSGYNDMFAFFVNGPKPEGGNYSNQNIALVPFSTLPVSINSINNGVSGVNGSAENCSSLSNSAYYVDNSSGLTIGYDGFTIVLSAQVNVIPGQTYSFKFIVADISDSNYDSGVFIKAESLSIFFCQAGTLSFENGSSPLAFCTNDDIADVLQVQSTSFATENYYFILADASGNILDYNTTGTFDVSAYGNAPLSFYGLSYDGDFTMLSIGDNLDNLQTSDDGCFELSEAITAQGEDCFNLDITCPAGQEISCLDALPAPNTADVVINNPGCGVVNVNWLGDSYSESNCPITIVRTYQVVDECGYEITCQQEFYFNDTQAPTFAPLTPYIHVECDELEDLPLPTVSDNCSGDVTITWEDILGSGGCLGTLIRTYTATDACGNSSSIEQYIGLLDWTGPVIENPANATVDCSVAPTQIPEILIYDACGLDVTITENSQEIVTIDECTYQIIWTFGAMDYCENESTATTVITVTDLENPTHTPVEDQAFSCTDEIPAPIAPIFSDNCDLDLEIIFTQDTILGNCPSNFQIVYSWTAIDNCGNSATATITYTVSDEDAPEFSDANQSYLVYACDEIVPVITPEVSDACSTFELDFSDSNAWTEGCNYGYHRTWVAIDACGNESSFVQYISILDNEAPVISGEIEIEIACDAQLEVYITAEDNCSDNVTITYSDELVSGGCEGRIIRNYSVDDNCGNVSTFEQIIFLIDTVEPFAAEPTDITVSCDIEDIEFDEVVFSDNCDEELSITTSIEYVNLLCSEYYVKTWIATDNCNNSYSVDQRIDLIDNQGPEFEFTPENYTAQCYETLEYTLPVISDNCHDFSYETVVDTTFGSCPGEYTITRTFNAIDACGNTSQAVQTIEVIDTDAPTWNEESAPFNLTFYCTDLVAGIEPSASDLCSEVSIAVAETLFVESSCLTYGAFIYTATDECGNESLPFYQFFVVADTIAPTIEGESVVEVLCQNYNSEEGFVSVSDECNSYELSFIDTPNDQSCAGSYTRIYTATDACGNTSNFEQTILLIDNENPTIEFAPENATVECGDEIPFVSAEFADNCDEQLAISFNEEVFEGTCGETITRIWTATDNCGNSNSVTQVITIVDTTEPNWVSIPENITITCIESVPASSALAYDVCNGYINASLVETSEEGDCDGSSVITRTFTATDACGNDISYSQTITIIDNIDPFFTFVPEGGEYLCSEFEGIPSAEASDLCSDVTVTYSDEVEVISIDGEEEDCGQFTTYSQGGWGAGNSAAANYRDANFDDAFPNGLVVGCDDGFTLTLSESEDVEDFLPAGGPSFVLTTNLVNPGNAYNNQLASQLVAATLSLGFDLYDPNFGDANGYIGDAIFSSGVFEGMTITEVVAIANNRLGGCTTDYTLNELKDAMETINLNWHAGDTDNGNFNCGSEPVCGVQTIRTWTATDDCGNTETASATYFIFDNLAPTFDAEVEDVNVSCGMPELVELTASDVCSSATVVRTTETLSADECGNTVIVVTYVATDACGNQATTSYTITVQDNIDPVFGDLPSSVVLACEDAIPAPAIVEATDNCGAPVWIDFQESYIGEIPAEGSISDCDILTPQGSSGNCFYPVNWAMAFWNAPDMYKYYTILSGEFVEYPNGSAVVNAQLVSVNNPNGGFNLNVTFQNKKDWAAWSTQSFPTSFKADCNGVDANYQSWHYFILANLPGSELTGWGDFAGSSLNLTHAPSSKYFGFQLGDGANNVTNEDNGFGGWFHYSGSFFDSSSNSEPSTLSGGGDFAFVLDCCPDYAVVRCWTAMDCSGNTTEYCQTISFEGSDINEEVIAPEVQDLTADAQKEEAQLSVYPNPASNMTNFMFKAKEDGKAMIEIFDLTGSHVATVYTSQVKAGNEYKTTVDVNNLATGVYMFRLTNGNAMEMGRIIIKR